MKYKQLSNSTTTAAAVLPGLNYCIGTVDKCLGPTTSKEPTKDCKTFWTYISQKEEITV